MAEFTTRGEQRRSGLQRARLVAGGASVGVAAFLTGVIAVVNAAPSSTADSNSDSSTQVQTNNGIGDDEYEPAEPFSPRSQTQVPVESETQATPQLEQPQTSSHGS